MFARSRAATRSTPTICEGRRRRRRRAASRDATSTGDGRRNSHHTRVNGIILRTQRTRARLPRAASTKRRPSPAPSSRRRDVATEIDRSHRPRARAPFARPRARFRYVDRMRIHRSIVVPTAIGRRQPPRRRSDDRAPHAVGAGVLVLGACEPLCA